MLGSIFHPSPVLLHIPQDVCVKRVRDGLTPASCISQGALCSAMERQLWEMEPEEGRSRDFTLLDIPPPAAVSELLAPARQVCGGSCVHQVTQAPGLQQQRLLSLSLQLRGGSGFLPLQTFGSLQSPELSLFSTLPSPM